MLVERGRLTLTLDVVEWLRHAQSVRATIFVPVDNDIALRAARLPDFLHRDPADRIIAATAQGLGAVLVTGDQRLLAYDRVRTVWD